MERKGVFATLVAVLMLAFTAGSAQAAFPGENGPIVFDSFDYEAQTSQIYVVRPDGSGLKRLTEPQGGESNFRPAFGPTGEKIVYTRSNEIRIMNLDGTGDVPLTGGYSPAFSPDGTKVVYSEPGIGADAISTINVDGSGYTQLLSGTYALNPAFSPDGSQIAYFGSQGLSLMDADGSNPHLVAVGGLAGNGRPSFSPDGSRIAFYSWYQQVGETEMGPGIHTIKLDGTDRVNEVPTVLPNQALTGAYSPDGQSLAYVNEFLEFPFVEGPPPLSIRIHDLTGGTSTAVPMDLTSIQSVDWGVYTRTCESDAAFCPPQPPPPPEECRMRFLKSRFFVFRGKPAYRLVTKYHSADAGEVRVSFYRRNADGSRGSSLGTLTKNFEAEGRFRLTRKVAPKVARKLRRSKTGFIAEFRILPREGFCEMAASLDLTKLERIQKQYIWFLRD